MSIEDQQQAEQAVREAAVILTTSADAYIQILIALESEKSYSAARKIALSTMIISSQTQLSTLELLKDIRSLVDKSYHPPLMAILALASIACSCSLISAAVQASQLDKDYLLSPKTLETMLNSKDVNAWLSLCLGANQQQ
jgi:hypothetical protein